MPCQDLFDLQSKSYKQKILGETNFKISIEAASTDCWKKYVGTEGLTFGIDAFGKSAPYKEIYEYFGLTAKNIAKKTRNLIKS
jgi:transketolase